MKAVSLRLLICLFAVSSLQTLCNNTLGGWSISKPLFDWICKVLPEGSAILECGSGFGSGQLSLHYEIHSIEHDRRWVGKFRGPNYIYAPIKHGWYDVSVLKKMLDGLSYNLILVDGPTGKIGRSGFLKNIHLFKTDGVILVFDDINRSAERKLMMDVAEKLGRKPMTLEDDKTVGILLP